METCRQYTQEALIIKSGLSLRTSAITIVAFLNAVENITPSRGRRFFIEYQISGSKISDQGLNRKFDKFFFIISNFAFDTIKL